MKEKAAQKDQQLANLLPSNDILTNKCSATVSSETDVWSTTGANLLSLCQHNTTTRELCSLHDQAVTLFESFRHRGHRIWTHCGPQVSFLYTQHSASKASNASSSPHMWVLGSLRRWELQLVDLTSLCVDCLTMYWYLFVYFFNMLSYTHYTNFFFNCWEPGSGFLCQAPPMDVYLYYESVLWWIFCSVSLLSLNVLIELNKNN